MAPKDQRPRARAKAAAAELPRRRRIDVRRLLPSGHSLLVGFSLLALGVASYGVARETGLFAIQHDRGPRCAARRERARGRGARAARGNEPRRSARDRPRPEDRRPARRDRGHARPGVPAHPSRVRRARARAPRPPAWGGVVARLGARPSRAAARARCAAEAAPDLGAARTSRSPRATRSPTAPRGGRCGCSSWPEPGSRPRVQTGPARRSRDDARPALRDRGAPGPRARPPAEARRRRARCCRGFPSGTAYLDVAVPDRPVAGSAEVQPQVEVDPTEG